MPAYPEVDTIIEKASCFTARTLGDTATAMMLTGSWADGKNNEESDVDIMVFTDAFDYARLESFEYERLQIQLVMLPLSRVGELLWLDYASLNGTYLDMIAKGLIMKDPDQYLTPLQTAVRKIMSMGPPDLPYNILKSKKTKLQHHSSDLLAVTPENYEQFLFVFMETSILCSELQLQMNGQWCSRGKHLLRELKSFDPAFVDRIMAANKQFYQEKRVDLLLEIAEQLLKKMGGAGKSYSRSPVVFWPKDDYYILQLATPADISSYLSLIGKQLFNNDQLHSYIDHSQSFTILSAPVGDANYEKESLYIFLRLKKEIKEDKYPALEKLLLGLLPALFPGQRFKHPVNYDISIILGNAAVTAATGKYLQLINTELATALRHESAIIGYAFRTIALTGACFFPGNPAAFKKFLRCCYRRWFTESADNGSIATVLQLHQRIGELEAQYEQAVNQNKAGFLALYESVNSSPDEAQTALLAQMQQLFLAVDLPAAQQHLFHVYPDNEDTSGAFLVIKEICRKSLEALLVKQQQLSFLAYAYLTCMP